MSYADSANIDTEARRYLKHHHLLSQARTRAYHYLNQTWLHVARYLNRELRTHQDLMSSTWVEVIAQEDHQYVGLHWHSKSKQGTYTITMADVRYYGDMRGEHIIFLVSANTTEARLHLDQCLSAEKVLSVYPEDLDLASHLILYAPEGDITLSMCLPLQFDHVKTQAKTLIAWAAPLWGLIESEAPVQSSHQAHKRTPKKSSRYPSAAPPLEEYDAYAQDQSVHSPYPDSIQPESIPFEDESQVSEYSQKRSQLSKRSARLIRSGEPHRPVDQQSTTRFVPRSLPRDPHNTVSHTTIQNTSVETSTEEQHLVASDVETQSVIAPAESSMVPQQPSPSDIPLGSTISDTSSTLNSEVVTSANSPIITPQSAQSSEIVTHTDSSVITPQTTSTTQALTFPTTQDEIRKPSYIKNIQEALQETPSDLQNSETELISDTLPSSTFDIEALIEALAKCGLSPWRINTYAQNQGKILWLQNGAHIDLNPQGDVILGGENQEDTRSMLTQLGIPI